MEVTKNSELVLSPNWPPCEGMVNCSSELAFDCGFDDALVRNPSQWTMYYGWIWERFGDPATLDSEYVTALHLDLHRRAAQSGWTVTVTAEKVLKPSNNFYATEMWELFDYEARDAQGVIKAEEHAHTGYRATKAACVISMHRQLDGPLLHTLLPWDRLTIDEGVIPVCGWLEDMDEVGSALLAAVDRGEVIGFDTEGVPPVLCQLACRLEDGNFAVLLERAPFAVTRDIMHSTAKIAVFGDADSAWAQRTLGNTVTATFVDVQAPPYTSFRVDAYFEKSNQRGGPIVRRIDEALSIKYPADPNAYVKKRDRDAFHCPNGRYRPSIWMSETLVREHINYAAADAIATVKIYEAMVAPM